MPSVQASGTQTAVIGTEQTLATVTASGVYVLVVDANAMAAGDTVELRLYLKTLSGSTSRVAYKTSYSGAQPADDMLKVSVPIVVLHQLDATLKQTAGTARQFDWELRAL